MNARDLFISHSSDDAETAHDLRDVLLAAGYTCWMAPDDIVGTDAWTEQILGAIKGSKAMIVLVSSASNKSQHVSREVNLALGRSHPVLPIRIENVPPEGSLEYLLSLVQRLDAFPPPISAHRDRILRRIQTILAPSADATAASPTTAMSTPPPPPPPPLVLPATEPAPPPLVTTPAPTPVRAALANRTLLIGGGIAAALIIVLLGANLLLKPGASPAPTQAAIASAQPTADRTAEPVITEPPVTEAPATEPPATVDASLFPNSFETQLEGLQPSPLVDASTCTRFTLESPDALATIACVSKPNEQWRAVFTLFPDVDKLEAAYAKWFTGIAQTTTHCWDFVQSNSGWYFTGSESVIRGQLGCYPQTEGEYKGVQIVWTYDDARVLGYWLSTDYQHAYSYYSDWVSGVDAALP